jgi:hypothetical protein
MVEIASKRGGDDMNQIATAGGQDNDKQDAAKRTTRLGKA